MHNLDKCAFTKVNELTNNRILHNPVYKSDPPADISLFDPVLIYNDGQIHKIVSFKHLSIYPLIYDKYFDNSKDNTGFVSDITVTCCPFTLTSIVYFGIYELHYEVYNNNIILSATQHNKSDKSDQDFLLFQLTGDTYSIQENKLIKNYSIRRIDTSIMLLRNAISMFPDCVYLHLHDMHRNNIDRNELDRKSLIEIESYRKTNMIPYSICEKGKNFNKYHPKTLVYGIIYQSKKHSFKTSVIVDTTASQKKTNSYNFKKNGYYKYFNEMSDKLKEKMSLSIPCYWFAWISFYPNSKIIQL